MTLPYESYRAIVNTKKLLSEIVTNSKLSKVEIKKQAKAALKHFPMDMDVEMWVSNNEKVTTEWLKPEAEKKGYIAIGRYDPVEYSVLQGGWIWWDESWSVPSNPYLTEAEARKEMNKYCKEVLGYGAEKNQEVPDEAKVV